MNKKDVITERAGFRLGDKVIYKKQVGTVVEGTVVDFEVRDRNWILVNFGKDFDGHNGNGHGQFNHTNDNNWWVTTVDLHKVNEQDQSQILINTDGTTVIATDDAGHEGKAICCPEDVFDFTVGAELAFSRLLENMKEVRKARRRAKPGEYVKIVSADSEWYKNGDIIKTLEMNELDCSIRGDNELNIRFSTETGCYLFDSEYVVLENFKPTYLDHFDPGKHYVFSKWLLWKHCYSNDKLSRTWINQCEGKLVEVEDNFQGSIKVPDYNQSYRILPEWCKEIDEETYKKLVSVKEGSLVRITDWGYNYSTYTDWVNKHMCDYAVYYQYGESIHDDKSDRTFTVLKIAPHSDDEDHQLAFIQEVRTEKCYLLGIDGIELRR